MFKFTIGCLEIVIYLVAKIMKNGKPFYMKLANGEWEPRPEVDYELLHVVEVTRDQKSDLSYWFDVRDGQGVIDPLEWEAGAWWKFSSPYKVTLRVALDEETNEVFKIGTKEKDGKSLLDVEHRDEPVEQPPAKPATVKKVPVEPVYQRVEVIKPRHNGNGHHRDDGKGRENSRDFRRAKNSLSERENEQSKEGRKEASFKDTSDEASQDEVAKIVSEDHSLVQKLNLDGVIQQPETIVN